MGAKKLYEAEILRLISSMQEDELAKVISFITKQASSTSGNTQDHAKTSKEKIFSMIESGYFNNKMQPSTHFSAKKEVDKQLDF
jgi:uncharacterized membrane protein